MTIGQQFIYIDNLSLIMMALVGFVALTVGTFSYRYLEGDRKRRVFFIYSALLVISVFTMVCADHLVLFFVAWALSNYFLTRLMLHKKQWDAAWNSSLIAGRNFFLGFIFLGSAFCLLYSITGDLSIQKITMHSIESPWTFIVALLLFLSAMSQSALWPFHRWLISSLNSPTPVSAFMHAGLINGGGFLLARFASLYLESILILNLIFCVGVFTAVIGNLWKLMQNDVKRLLACSTMGQMGFMMIQCGLGLFSAAIAHLCWHGVFKAYLFLGSGSVAQVKRLDLEYPPKIYEFLIALVCGAIGALTFGVVSKKSLSGGDTGFFLVMIALIAGTQLALSIVRNPSMVKILIAFVLTTAGGGVYGMSVLLVGLALVPLQIDVAHSLNLIHFSALLIFAVCWIYMLFNHIPQDGTDIPQWKLKGYVSMLNASQPHPETVTTFRNQYQY